MSAGGTERWLQEAAIVLSKSYYTIDYYYTDHNLDNGRFEYLKNSHVNLIRFNVDKRMNNITNDWFGTNFWDFFDEDLYDFIQTAKFCKAEYPFHLLKKPVIQKVAFAVELDLSSSIYHTFLPSKWLQEKWFNLGASKAGTSVISPPVSSPSSEKNLKTDLKISENVIIAGFHQRVDDKIASYIPLLAFKLIENKKRAFVIMGGGKKYQYFAKLFKIKNIHFIEHSSDPVKISRFLNTLDIYAHGRKDGETFGTVLAEALIHGLPCITHRSKIDNAQKFTFGTHGYFCSNLFNYTWKLWDLFRNDKLRDMLSSGSRDFSKRQYGYRTFSKLILKSYNKFYKSYYDR